MRFWPSGRWSGFANSEHLCTAGRAISLGGRTSVLQSDLLGIADFSLFPAFQAICLHGVPPPLVASLVPYWVFSQRVPEMLESGLRNGCLQVPAPLFPNCNDSPVNVKSATNYTYRQRMSSRLASLAGDWLPAVPSEYPRRIACCLSGQSVAMSCSTSMRERWETECRRYQRHRLTPYGPECWDCQ
jgi:hypothetical protein